MSDLHQFFFLALDLQKARAQWEAAQSRADNVNVHAHVSSRGELLNFLRTWRPDDGIVFEREDISEWADDFSWGASLAKTLLTGYLYVFGRENHLVICQHQAFLGLNLL